MSVDTGAAGQWTALPAEFIDFAVRLAGDPRQALAPLPVSAGTADLPLAEALGLDAKELRDVRDRLRRQLEKDAASIASSILLTKAVSAWGITDTSRILVLGDSLSADLLSWANLLGAALEQTTPGIGFVNAAVSGRTTTETLAVTAALLKAHDPTHVFLLLGTNDIRRQGEHVGIPMVSLNETKRNFEALQQMVATESQARLISLTPAPLGPAAAAGIATGTWWKPEDLPGLASVIAEVFPDTVRLDHALKDDVDMLLSADGVHPNPAGHVALLTAVLRAAWLGDES